MSTDDPIQARQKRGNRIFLFILLTFVAIIFAISIYHVRQTEQPAVKTMTAVSLGLAAT